MGGWFWMKERTHNKMKMELIRDGKVVDTITGGAAWIAQVRMTLTHATEAREVPDDTPDLLKTSTGQPFWMV